MKKIVRGLLILILILCGLYGWHIYSEYQKSQKEYEELESYVEEYTEVTMEAPSSEEEVTQEAATEETVPAMEYPAKNISHDSLAKMNPEYVAWIYIEALGINYPVVQGEDDQKYQHTSFRGEENIAGAIFLDAYNESDFTSWSTFIFGHNMRNGTMFGKLKEFYRDESGTLAKDDPYIYLYTKDEVIKYEICSYYITTNDSDIYRDIQSREEYDTLLEEITGYSLYEPEHDMNLAESEHLLTLSTCSGVSGNKRFVVHAVEIGRERIET